MGIVYLIQPTELIGTDVYKIGCSRQSDLSRINTGYRKGTEPVYITHVEHPFDAERLIKTHFAKLFTLKAGAEMFSGKLADMKQCYKKAIDEYETQYEPVEVQEEEEEEVLVPIPPVNPLACPKCERILSSKQTLTAHMARCDGLDPKQCKICLKLFSTRQGKSQHMRFVNCKLPNTD